MLVIGDDDVNTNSFLAGHSSDFGSPVIRRSITQLASLPLLSTLCDSVSVHEESDIQMSEVKSKGKRKASSAAAAAPPPPSSNQDDDESWRLIDGREVDVSDNLNLGQFICEDCGTTNEFDQSKPDTRFCRSADCKQKRHERGIALGVHQVAKPPAASASASAKDSVTSSPAKKSKKADPAAATAAAAAATAPKEQKQPDLRASDPKSMSIGFALAAKYIPQTALFKQVDAFKYQAGANMRGVPWNRFRLHPTDPKKRDLVVSVSIGKDGKLKLIARNTADGCPAVFRSAPHKLGGATDNGLFGNHVKTSKRRNKPVMVNGQSTLAAKLFSAKKTWQCPAPLKGTDVDMDAWMAWMDEIDAMVAAATLKVDPALKADFEGVKAELLANEDHPLWVRWAAANKSKPTEAEKEQIVLKHWMRTNWKPAVHEPKTLNTAEKRELARELYGGTHACYYEQYAFTHFKQERPIKEVTAALEHAKTDLASAQPEYKDKIAKKAESVAGLKAFLDAMAEGRVDETSLSISPEVLKDEKGEPKQRWPLVVPCWDPAGKPMTWAQQADISAGDVVCFDYTLGIVGKGTGLPHVTMNIVGIRVLSQGSGGGAGDVNYDDTITVEAVEGAQAFQPRDSAIRLLDSIRSEADQPKPPAAGAAAAASRALPAPAGELNRVD